MQTYIIRGGKSLRGSVELSGNKNAALPCIAAALLTDERVILRNIPHIEDVRIMCAIARRLGMRIVEEAHCLTLHTPSIRSTVIPHDLASKIRASFLFAGPLVAREGQATLAPPGGDVIGRRRLDTHIMALEALGAHCDIGAEYHFAVGTRLCGARIFLDQASVTATENALTAAVLAKGETVIENAACEPHTQDLCLLLNAMGARIRGIGSNVLVIEGVDRLGGAEITIGCDYMELGSFIGLAAATKGNIEIRNVGACPLPMIALNFRKLGVVWEESAGSILVDARQPRAIQPDIGGQIPYIDDAPWPGFPADLISIALVVATQSQGVILFHEKMYESRLFFVDKLISMGAQIIICDPHRAVVNGPTRLHGAVLSSPDVRAGMALIIAALCASGTSVIQNIYQINRGYQNIVDRLSHLGADINEEER